MAWAVIALGVIGVKSVSAQCMYEVTVVTGPPCFPDPNISVGFEGINDLGQACGWQAICGQLGARRPLVWTEELGIVLLPLPEGATQGVANDINNVLGSDGFGQVACTLMFPALGAERGYLYHDGEWTDLGVLPGATHSRCSALNDSTEIVGECEFPFSDHPARAIQWIQGAISQVEFSRSPESSAGCLNEWRTIGGWIGESFIENEGVLLVGDSVDAIPFLPGAFTGTPTAVNDADTTCGHSLIQVKSGPVPQRSWKYENGRLTDLGTLSGTVRCIAEDINDTNQVIGTCFGEFGCCNAPFLWQDSQLYRLRDLIDLPPQVLGFANVKAINNRGQIVGMSGGASHGLILTPNVPLGDVNIDCVVDERDLVAVLDDWGPDKHGHSTDMVTSSTFQPPGDGVVDGADLAVVLGNWTERSSFQSRRN